MSRLTTTSTILALTAIAAAPAGAEQFSASLNGYAEVPSVSTTGSGVFTATVNDAEDEISFELTYGNLEGGTVSAAHIHFGRSRTNGAVIAFLCGGTAKACLNAGTVTGTLDADDVVAVAAQGIAAGELDELIDAMRSQSTYVNVHTQRFASGEIRGDID